MPLEGALLESTIAAALGSGEDSEAAGSHLFREWVEPLSDSFTKAGVDEYLRLFPDILASVLPGFPAGPLRDRYHRIRDREPFSGPRDAVRDVVVLSRVTLGADVAVTSVVLDAARQAFPDATLHLAGNRKNWELFAGERRLRLLEAPYARRGGLRGRLEASAALAARIPEGALVIDPDSRLSQLGLIPMGEDDRYYFFESRSAQGPGTLGQLTAEWCRRMFGAAGRAWIAPEKGLLASPRVCVSFGTGGNPDKGLGPEFEAGVLRHLVRRGLPLLIDKGMGGEEGERVERAAAGLNGVETWLGAFAPFAFEIARAPLYIGYDSSGQHVAAAAGTPLVCAFQGAPSERFFERWRPHGAGPARVVRDAADPLGEVCRAADELISRRAS